MDNFLNMGSYQICKNYFSESYTNFLLTDVKAKDKIEINSHDFNHIIVILKGRLLIEYDEYVNTEFPEGDITFIPAYSKSHIEALEDSRVLLGTFEMPKDICTTRAMESLEGLRSKITYKFTSLPIRPVMREYLNLLVAYLESGMRCAHLHEIKEKEIFLLFRWYYTDEEFVRLFHPIIGKSLDFRMLIIKNYTKVNNVEDLARIAGMSRSNFDAKFKEAFGMPPKHWMLERKARNVKYYMSKPGVTISDVMIQFGFDSFTHFNRFCRQHFGMSPSELIKQKDIRYKPVYQEQKRF